VPCRRRRQAPRSLPPADRYARSRARLHTSIPLQQPEACSELVGGEPRNAQPLMGTRWWQEQVAQGSIIQFVAARLGPTPRPVPAAVRCRPVAPTPVHYASAPNSAAGAGLSRDPASGPAIPTVMHGALSAAFVACIDTGVHNRHTASGVPGSTRRLRGLSARPSTIWTWRRRPHAMPSRLWRLFQRRALSAPHPSTPSTWTSARAPPEARRLLLARRGRRRDSGPLAGTCMAVIP
jgi:hypothetical protein